MSKIISNTKKIDECSGCCYRRINKHTKEKCNYLKKWRCMIKEAQKR